jgi:hypothetical protein
LLPAGRRAHWRKFRLDEIALAADLIWPGTCSITGVQQMTKVDWENYLVLAAAAQGLDIPQPYRAGVVANLERIAAIAERFLAVPLDDDDEPAPAFRP